MIEYLSLSLLSDYCCLTYNADIPSLLTTSMALMSAQPLTQDLGPEESISRLLQLMIVFPNDVRGNRSEPYEPLFSTFNLQSPPALPP